MWQMCSNQSWNLREEPHNRPPEFLRRWQTGGGGGCRTQSQSWQDFFPFLITETLCVSFLADPVMQPVRTHL